MSTNPDVWLPNDGHTALALVSLTIASVCAVHLMPFMLKRHMSQVAIYAHEVSHGVMNLLTGGAFHRFHVTTWGGVAVTSGGNQKAVLAAGYIGTIVFGAMLLVASAQLDGQFALLRVMAVLLALSTLKAGDLQTAALGSVITKILAASTTLVSTPMASCFVANLLGVLLVWGELRARWMLLVLSATTSGTNSDAEVLARLTGRSSMFWAFVCGGIGIVALLISSDSLLLPRTPGHSEGSIGTSAAGF